MENNKQRPAMREFDMGWKEYFKSKPKPKNDEEEKKQLEEFHYWYNNVRKQSDTGKTPAEMYKEIYGKEPLKNPTEVSRMMNFEWDEDYNEDQLIIDEAVREADEIFEKEIWRETKEEMKELNRKEACKSMFSLGFLAYMKLMDEQVENFEKKAKQNPKEFDEALKKVKDKITIKKQKAK